MVQRKRLVEKKPLRKAARIIPHNWHSGLERKRSHAIAIIGNNWPTPMGQQ